MSAAVRVRSLLKSCRRGWVTDFLPNQVAFSILFFLYLWDSKTFLIAKVRKAVKSVFLFIKCYCNLRNKVFFFPPHCSNEVKNRNEISNEKYHNGIPCFVLSDSTFCVFRRCSAVAPLFRSISVFPRCSVVLCFTLFGFMLSPSTIPQYSITVVKKG